MMYKELRDRIDLMTNEQKNMLVTIFVSDTDEFYPIGSVSFATAKTDVLDKDHPILNIE